MNISPNKPAQEGQEGTANPHRSHPATQPPDDQPASSCAGSGAV